MFRNFLGLLLGNSLIFLLEKKWNTFSKCSSESNLKIVVFIVAGEKMVVINLTRGVLCFSLPYYSGNHPTNNVLSTKKKYPRYRYTVYQHASWILYDTS